MGMIDRFLGVGEAAASVTDAAGNVAEIFRPNATRRMELNEEAYARAIAQMGAEFAQAPQGWFDRLVNGLNRLPRPMLALGTLGLFIYAMADPTGFSARMQGLALVPEPLWWLLGAIVSFYFGAREAHYFRHRRIIRDKIQSIPTAVQMHTDIMAAPTDIVTAPEPTEAVKTQNKSKQYSAAAKPHPKSNDFPDNAALQDWAKSQQNQPADADQNAK